MPVRKWNARKATPKDAAPAVPTNVFVVRTVHQRSHDATKPLLQEATVLLSAADYDPTEGEEAGAEVGEAGEERVVLTELCEAPAELREGATLDAAARPTNQRCVVRAVVTPSVPAGCVAVAPHVLSLGTWFSAATTVVGVRLAPDDERALTARYGLSHAHITFAGQFVSRSDLYDVVQALQHMPVFAEDEFEVDGLRFFVSSLQRAKPGVEGAGDWSRVNGTVGAATVVSFTSLSHTATWLFEVSSDLHRRLADGRPAVGWALEDLLPRMVHRMLRGSRQGRVPEVRVVLFGRLAQGGLGFITTACAARGEEGLRRLPAEVNRQLHLFRDRVARDWGRGASQDFSLFAPSPESNLLEAVNVVLERFIHHNVNRSLTVSGNGITIITPGQGLLCTPERGLAELTTRRIDAIGLRGCTLVVIGPPPFHTCPLLEYWGTDPQVVRHKECTAQEKHDLRYYEQPHWLECLFFDGEVPRSVFEPLRLDLYSRPEWMRRFAHRRPARPHRIHTVRPTIDGLQTGPHAAARLSCGKPRLIPCGEGAGFPRVASVCDHNARVGIRDGGVSADVVAPEGTFADAARPDDVVPIDSAVQSLSVRVHEATKDCEQIRLRFQLALPAAGHRWAFPETRGMLSHAVRAAVLYGHDAAAGPVREVGDGTIRRSGDALLFAAHVSLGRFVPGGRLFFRVAEGFVVPPLPAPRVLPIADVVEERAPLYAFLPVSPYEDDRRVTTHRTNELSPIEVAERRWAELRHGEPDHWEALCTCALMPLRATHPSPQDCRDSTQRYPLRTAALARCFFAEALRQRLQDNFQIVSLDVAAGTALVSIGYEVHSVQLQGDCVEVNVKELSAVDEATESIVFRRWNYVTAAFEEMTYAFESSPLGGAAGRRWELRDTWLKELLIPPPDPAVPRPCVSDVAATARRVSFALLPAVGEPLTDAAVHALLRQRFSRLLCYGGAVPETFFDAAPDLVVDAAVGADTPPRRFEMRLADDAQFRRPLYHALRPGVHRAPTEAETRPMYLDVLLTAAHHRRCHFLVTVEWLACSAAVVSDWTSHLTLAARTAGLRSVQIQSDKHSRLTPACDVYPRDTQLLPTAAATRALRALMDHGYLPDGPAVGCGSRLLHTSGQCLVLVESRGGGCALHWKENTFEAHGTPSQVALHRAFRRVLQQALAP